MLLLEEVEVEVPVLLGEVPGGHGLVLIPVRLGDVVWPGEVVEGLLVCEGEVTDGVPV